MRVLVAGDRQVDAGKTTFALGLAERLDAVAFKPRAANDLWFDYEAVRSVVGNGRLVGRDARRLAAGNPEPWAAERINPIHRLWRPSPGGDPGLLGRANREFLVDRVGDRFVVNGRVELPTILTRHLPLEGAHEVTSLDELNRVMADRHLPALADLRERLLELDRVVVESYGDVAKPIEDVPIDVAAVVEPGRVRYYRGDRFLRACEAVGSSPREGRLEPVVGEVVEPLDPLERRSLRPIPGAKAADPGAVAGAYEEAYDALERVLSSA